MNDNPSYSQLKERLDQIVAVVNDESISLEDALSLYEEAVKLGSQASALIEADINSQTADQLAESLAEAQPAAESPAAGEVPSTAEPQPEDQGAAEA